MPLINMYSPRAANTPRQARHISSEFSINTLPIFGNIAIKMNFIIILLPLINFIIPLKESVPVYVELINSHPKIKGIAIPTTAPSQTLSKLLRILLISFAKFYSVICSHICLYWYYCNITILYCGLICINIFGVGIFKVSYKPVVVERSWS